jgi:hypothetical protein
VGVFPENKKGKKSKASEEQNQARTMSQSSAQDACTRA